MGRVNAKGRGDASEDSEDDRPVSVIETEQGHRGMKGLEEMLYTQRNGMEWR